MHYLKWDNSNPIDLIFTSILGTEKFPGLEKLEVLFMGEVATPFLRVKKESWIISLVGRVKSRFGGSLKDSEMLFPGNVDPCILKQEVPLINYGKWRSIRMTKKRVLSSDQWPNW